MTSLYRAQKRLMRQRYGYKRAIEFPFDVRDIKRFCERHQVEIVVIVIGLVCSVDSLADWICK